MSEVLEKVVIDFEAGTVTSVQLTEEEIAEKTARAEAAAVRAAEAEARENAKETVRAGARAKLAALGLTEEEIAAIIGG